MSYILVLVRTSDKILCSCILSSLSVSSCYFGLSWSHHVEMRPTQTLDPQWGQGKTPFRKKLWEGQYTQRGIPPPGRSVL